MKYIPAIIAVILLISCSNNIEVSSEKICVNTCENNGDTFCEGTKVYVCKLNEKNCLEKELKQVCENTEICRMGKCNPSQCSDECFYENETSCEENNIVKCGNFDEDICFEKSIIETCSENQECLTRECIEIDLCENIICQNWEKCNTTNGICEMKEGF